MIALIQRVRHAAVHVDGIETGAIERGLLALVGVVPEDTEERGRRLIDRVLGYRVFEDDAGRMNLGLLEAGGSLLLVPQFTLAADTRKGMRPSFSSAAAPEQARQRFDQCVEYAHTRHSRVATGRFGADMQVSLTNDGPVTFWLEA